MHPDLDRDPLGVGQQATVYFLTVPHDDKVIKVFDDAIDAARSHAIFSRAGALHLGGDDGVAVLPVAFVEKDGLIEAIALEYLGSPWVTLDIAFNATLSLQKRLDICCSLARATADVHTRGFVIGDFKPKNLMLDAARAKIKFIDVDSWGLQPSASGTNQTVLRTAAPPAADFGHIDAEMLEVKYLPPPVGGTHVLSKSTDRFALGVIILQLLTGHHPFGSTRKSGGFDSYELRIANGDVWLRAPDEFVLPEPTIAPEHPGYRALPRPLREAAMTTLEGGSADPPTANQWIDALETTYVTVCVRCQADMFIGGNCPGCGQLPPPPIKAGDRSVPPSRIVGAAMGISTWLGVNATAHEPGLFALAVLVAIGAYAGPQIERGIRRASGSSQ